MPKKKLSLLERGRAGSLPPSLQKATEQEVETGAARAVDPAHHGATVPSVRPPLAGSNPPSAGPRVFTGVGRQIAEGNINLTRELALVREKLASYEGFLPLRLLDPKRIRRSKYANRHASEFNTPDFRRFKQLIVDAGVNVQPIKVRPTKEDPDYDFEVAFGHRRHQATLESGLPVLAFIEEMNDQELWLVMARENLERKDMSPWEQGKSLLQAMETGLFPSHRRLAFDLGVDPSNAMKLLSLARLPDALLAAFSAPTDLQMLWSKPLSDALQRDPDSVISRANALAALVPRKAAKLVFEELIAEPETAKPIEVKVNGKVVAVIKRKGKGGATVTMPVVSDLKALEGAIKKLFGA